MFDLNIQSSEADEVRKKWAESDTARDNGIIPAKVKEISDITYADSDSEDEKKWHLTDIYYPENSHEKVFPVIVNVHGGGWFYGDKELYSLYCKMLASNGFSVVNFNYRLAPAYKYPCAVIDVCQLVSFISDNSEKYNLDMDRFCIVGDSAGAQLASQYSVIASNTEYRKFFPETEKMKLPVPKKAAFNCGIYDVLPAHSEMLNGWYLPEKMDSQLTKSAEHITSYMNEDFPESFVMASVNDPLRHCSEIILDNLKKNNVPHIYREYGQKNPDDGHVFHMNFRSSDAEKCNQDEINFFKGDLNL